MFTDGRAALTDMIRAYARSPRGTRARGAAPGGRRRRPGSPGALGIGGVAGAMASGAATSGAVFAACLDRVLLPELKRAAPDAVIAMANLGAHETGAVRALPDRSGAAYRYLPPYASGLNPIELAWAKIKAYLCTAAARTAAALHAAVGGAPDAVAPGGGAGYFHHAGYGV